MSDETRDVNTPSKTVKQALERFKLSVEAGKQQREREKGALEFQVPALQWPKEVKESRAGQVIAGVTIAPRPMISIPKLDQPVQLVLNQEKAAHLGVTIHALSEDADDETATKIQGLYRRIEVDSRANLARSWAFERATKAGRGCYRVDKAFADEGGSRFDQKIVIRRLLYQGAAHFDPFAQEPDWSDGRWAFVTQDLPWERFKEKYPTSKMATYTDSEFVALGHEEAGWFTGVGEGRTVRIAEYWRIAPKTRKLVLLDDGADAYEDEIPEGRTAAKTDTGAYEKERDVDEPVVLWSTINCVEELEPEQEWDGKYIPLIPTIGRELQPFDGERRWVGIIEPAMDAARLFNYAASGAIEMAALETKAPYMMAEGQEEGHTTEFQLANVRNFPYLLYKPTSLNGELVPAPQRTQVDASRLGPSMALLQEADSFIQASTATFDPSLGNLPQKDRSGKAILALQQQADAGQSHYLDNLVQITLAYEAKVVLDLMPRVYDRPGRIARLLGTDDTPETVMLNAPFTMDPKTKRPQPAQLDPQTGQPLDPKAKTFDLRKGIYGVVPTIGKSYQTRLQQGADELGEILVAAPQLLQVLGDLYFKFREFPGHMEAAERMKKMLPPQLQEGQQGQPSIEQVQGQLKKAMGMLDALTKELNAKNEIIQTDKTKSDAQIEITKIDAQLQVDLQEKKNAATIRVAEINAAVKGYATEAAHAAAHEAQALDQNFAAGQASIERETAAHEAERTRQHEAEQAQAGVEGQIAVQAAAPTPQTGAQG